MKTNVYDNAGKVARSIDLPEHLFGLNWNADLVHQVVTGMQSNARANTAHTKDRSEVSGGGRKPWRQKGTGQARHGSKRSPIWSGGGITFGPRNERNYDKKINRKMRSKALLVALSQKMRDGQILFVEDMNTVSGKTTDMEKILKNFESVSGFETINTKKHNNIFMTAAETSDTLKRAASNIYHLSLQDITNLNALDVMNHRYLVIANPEASVEFLQTKVNSN